MIQLFRLTNFFFFCGTTTTAASEATQVAVDYLQGVGLPCLCASSNVDPMTPMYRMISRVGRDMHIMERKNTETMMRQNRQCVEW